MTTENNKIIAEFMGYAIIDKEGNHKDIDYKYHSSWDWLMKVVEKIEQEGASVIIGRFFCEIKYENPLNQKQNYSLRLACGIKINAVYEATLDFIKWYNKNKN